MLFVDEKPIALRRCQVAEDEIGMKMTELYTASGLDREEGLQEEIRQVDWTRGRPDCLRSWRAADSFKKTCPGPVVSIISERRPQVTMFAFFAVYV